MAGNRNGGRPPDQGQRSNRPRGIDDQEQPKGDEAVRARHILHQRGARLVGTLKIFEKAIQQAPTMGEAVKREQRQSIFQPAPREPETIGQRICYRLDAIAKNLEHSVKQLDALGSYIAMNERAQGEAQKKLTSGAPGQRAMQGDGGNS